MEYSQQCNHGSLSSWAQLQEERFEIYSQESRTGSLSNWAQEEDMIFTHKKVARANCLT